MYVIDANNRRADVLSGRASSDEHAGLGLGRWRRLGDRRWQRSTVERRDGAGGVSTAVAKGGDAEARLTCPTGGACDASATRRIAKR